MSFQVQTIMELKGGLGTIQSVLVVFTVHDNFIGLFDAILGFLETL